jgi:hypothetical protein
VKSLKLQTTVLVALFVIAVPARAQDVTVHFCQRFLETVRVVNGGHPIYEIKVKHPNFREMLPETLKEFGRNKPTLKNKLKQYILFNPLLIRGTHWALTGRRENAMSVDLYKAIKPGVKYNYVIHGNPNDPDEATILIGAVEVRYKRLDDLLSKHLLLANFIPTCAMPASFGKTSKALFISATTPAPISLLRASSAK